MHYQIINLVFMQHIAFGFKSCLCRHVVIAISDWHQFVNNQGYRERNCAVIDSDSSDTGKILILILSY